MDEFVTEKAEELFDAGECDLSSLDALLNDKNNLIVRKYNGICFHASQAVEKFLKGFIKENEKDIKKTHDLNKIIKDIIDNSFIQIKDDCISLNKFTPSLKYTTPQSNNDIKEDIKNMLISLQKICDFPQIKTLREVYSKKNNYPLLKNVYINLNSILNDNKKETNITDKQKKSQNFQRYKTQIQLPITYILSTLL